MKRSEANKEPTKPQPKPELKSPPVVDNNAKIPIQVGHEVVVIAASLIDRVTRKRLLGQLPTDAFWGKGHREMWDGLRELERQDLDYDAITLEQLGGGLIDVRTMEQYRESRPSMPLNLNFHVAQMQWTQKRVEVMRGPVAELVELLRDPSCDMDRVRAMARSVGASFEGSSVNRFLRDPDQLEHEVRQRMDERRAGLAYYPFGLPGFDLYGPDDPEPGERRLVRGVEPGLCTIVTGTSGGGKSTFTAALAVKQAELQRRVLYGAWEQLSAGTLELCAGLALGLERRRVLTGRLTPDELEMFYAKVRSLNKYIRFFEVPFDRYTTGGKKRRTNDESLDVVQQYITDAAPHVFIADLWQRVLTQLSPDEEALALRRQQSMLQETRCHGILVHQLNLKLTEATRDARPTRDKLKGSGLWVDIADYIFAVYRQGLYKNIDDNTMEVMILKQRDGVWPLSVMFDFDPKRGVLQNGRSVPVTRIGDDHVDEMLGFGKIPRGNKK